MRISKIGLHGSRRGVKLHHFLDASGRSTTMTLDVYGAHRRKPEYDIRFEETLYPFDTVFLDDEVYVDQEPPLSLPRSWKIEGRKLVLSPKSASWLVLDGFELRVLERLRKPTNLRSLVLEFGERARDIVVTLLEQGFLRVKDSPYTHPYVMPTRTHRTFFSLHLTERCNLRCRYCYVDVRNGEDMDLDTAKLIIDRITESYGDLPITIELHGGEPLMNWDVVKGLLDHVRDKVSSGALNLKGVLLQTNGLLLDEEKLKVLEDHRVKVGVSLDGPKEVHERNRGQGTWEKVLRAVELLKGSRSFGGVLAVAVRPADFKVIAEFFVEGLHLNSFRINHLAFQWGMAEGIAEAFKRLTGFGFHDLEVYLKTMAEGFLEMVDYLRGMLDRGWKGKVYPLVGYLNNILSKHRPYMCMSSPCGAVTRGLGFSPKGDVYPCEQMIGFEGLKLGSVYDGVTLEEMVSRSEIAKRLMERKVERLEGCSTCPWRYFCGGGCASEAFSVYGDLMHRDAHCSFYEQVLRGLMWRLYHDPRYAELI